MISVLKQYEELYNVRRNVSSSVNFFVLLRPPANGSGCYMPASVSVVRY
jgi:hypothetical protein